MTGGRRLRPAAQPPLAANTVIAVGNCGLYLGPWGIRVEDTVVAGPAGPELLTSYPRALTKWDRVQASAAGCWTRQKTEE